MSKATYSQDVAFLKQHVDIVEFAAASARVAVVPAWQGRVMTSSLAGEAGAGFGWINREFIAAGREDPAFNNYGGEDRLWLGPEAGQFGLWFAPGDPFDLDHWKTPEGFGSGPVSVTSQGAGSIAMASQFRVTNCSGGVFDCAVKRTINVLDEVRAGELLRMPVPEGVRMAGFESENVLANTGEQPWSHDGGLLSVWVLGQFKPLPRGRVIVPLRPGSDVELGPKATTNYFGELPPERCAIGEDYLLFVCDGRFRSKIGVGPRRSRGLIGSYDADAGVLTLVQFNQPLTASELPYVNSLWKVQDKPFAGDAINSYNDGDPQVGGGQVGRFYELESSSPAAALQPGQAITHAHRTFHFEGQIDALNALARKLLNIDLTELEL